MKRLLILLFIVSSSIAVRAQSGMLWNRYYISGSLSVGQESRLFADTSAWMQLGKDTTNKGLLLPRVMLDSIHTTKRGLFVYDLKDSVLYHFDSNRRVRYMTYKDSVYVKDILQQYRITDSITEGVNNKYYTDARVRNAISGGIGISYNSGNGVVSNSGVLSVDGSAGAVSLATTYFRNGGNAFTANSSIGSTSNFGVDIITNNAPRLTLTNLGKTTINASSEEVFTVTNGQVNKINMGIGTGGQISLNMPYILFGSSYANDPAIIVSNSGSNTFSIRKIHTFTFGAPDGSAGEFRGAMTTSQTGSVFYIGSAANSIGTGHFGTSGTLNWLVMPHHVGGNSDIKPTCGKMEVNVLNIPVRVNQTGTANGTVRAIYINPNLISAPDFRAIVMTNNSGYGIYQSGAAAKNYFNGNIGIKVASPVEALEVDGRIKTAQPSANGAGAVKIGKVVTGVSLTLQTDKYLEVEIDGVIRKLAIVD